MNYDQFFSSTARGMKRSEIRELLKLTRKPGTISFAGGLPSSDVFPVDEVKEISKVVLEKNGKMALQYGPTEGENRLKEEILRLMEKDGLKISPEQIVIVTSSQQGIDLVGKIFINPGDVVIMGGPTYVGAIQAFNSYGANMVGVQLESDGIRVDLVEQEIKKWIGLGKKPRFIYEIPDFQNPSGITTTLKKRRELIRIAEAYDLMIVEDSPCRQLSFEGANEPMLLSMSRERVLSLFTFSKILCPGFRLGWVAGPAELIYKLVTAKQAVDLCSPPFIQLIVGEFLSRGLLAPHVEKIRRVYREKRDFMLSKLSEYMPKIEGLQWTHPRGGLFLWLTLPEDMDMSEMLPMAVEKKVAYVVGTAFFPDGRGKNCCRLNFSYPTLEEIDLGIKRLAELIKDFAH